MLSYSTSRFFMFSLSFLICFSLLSRTLFSGIRVVSSRRRRFSSFARFNSDSVRLRSWREMLKPVEACCCYLDLLEGEQHILGLLQLPHQLISLGCQLADFQLNRELSALLNLCQIELTVSLSKSPPTCSTFRVYSL